MANAISYATIFRRELDKQVLQGATSGWMEQNAGNVIYNGGRDVKIPSISATGLGDYNRANSTLPQGSVTFAYETFTMTKDRGAKFIIDEKDVEETNYSLAIATVAAEFQRVNVIPEIDAYRYSTIANFAGVIKKSYYPDAATVFSELQSDLAQIRDLSGLANDQLVITMAIPVASLLASAAEISRFLSVSDFKRGEITTKVKSLDGAPIVEVSSANFQTAYTFNSGASSWGFAPASNAAALNWIICPKNAPIAVSKTDEVGIISPKDNQNGYGYIVKYRKYHDLWLTKNKAALTLASKYADPPDPEA
jgi:hypothetical protein